MSKAVLVSICCPLNIHVCVLFLIVLGNVNSLKFSLQAAMEALFKTILSVAALLLSAEVVMGKEIIIA
jgi:hypothetical protein